MQEKSHTCEEAGAHLIFIELWKNPKNQNFKKIKTKKKKKKLLEILSFYTCVPKITIIWGTVPEVQRMKKWNFQKK